MVCLRPYPFKFFKGCLPQISLGPLLNTLSHLRLTAPKYSAIWDANASLPHLENKHISTFRDITKNLAIHFLWYF